MADKTYVVLFSVTVSSTDAQTAAETALHQLRTQNEKVVVSVLPQESGASLPVMAEIPAIPDEVRSARGAQIAETLYLRQDQDYPDRFETTGGNKTPIGLFETVKRLLYGS